MRVAINCRSILGQKRTGVGRYTWALIEHLKKADQAGDYLLYVQRALFDRKRATPPIGGGNFKIRHDFFKFGPQKTLGRIDLYHAPSPEDLKIQGCKIVVTVHDLIHRTFPQGHTASTIEMSERQLQEIARRADKIICCSNSTRRDLHEHYKIESHRSAVVYQGVDRQIFYPMEKAGHGDELFLKAQGLEGPYLLFVGTIEPRKNLTNLLEALAILKSKNNFTGQLAIVGMTGWMSEDLESFVEKLGLSSSVRFLGFVPDDDLRIFYNKALALVFPSFYEGFGFPIVEAMSCGTPVVTSNTSACLEVAGDAALTVSPREPQEIADAVLKIMDDDSLLEKLIVRGLVRSEEFSFEKTAQKTLGIYKEVCGL